MTGGGGGGATCGNKVDAYRRVIRRTCCVTVIASFVLYDISTAHKQHAAANTPLSSC